MSLQRMIPRSICVAAMLAGVAQAAPEVDPFESTLTMHRVRSSHTQVNGTLNVAYGPGLMNPATSVEYRDDGRQPPIHEVNLVARCAGPIYLPVDPAFARPIEVFNVTREHSPVFQSQARDRRIPGFGDQLAAGRSSFGSVRLNGAQSLTQVHLDVQSGDIRTISRASESRQRD